MNAKQKLSPSPFHLYSGSQILDGPEKCRSKGDGSCIFWQTPCCSLMCRVSPRASHGHEPDKHQHSLSNICMAPGAFAHGHLSRVVPMVGCMVVTLQVSLVKVFCICTRYVEKNMPRWKGSGDGCCHCSKWKEEVVCRREEIMRLKEIGGIKKKGVAQLTEDMPQGFSSLSEATSLPNSVRPVVCRIRCCILCIAVLAGDGNCELPKVSCTGCFGVTQRHRVHGCSREDFED